MTITIGGGDDGLSRSVGVTHRVDPRRWWCSLTELPRAHPPMRWQRPRILGLLNLEATDPTHRQHGEHRSLHRWLGDRELMAPTLVGEGGGPIAREGVVQWALWAGTGHRA
jgi:hypothetical protein